MLDAFAVNCIRALRSGRSGTGRLRGCNSFQLLYHIIISTYISIHLLPPTPCSMYVCIRPLQPACIELQLVEDTGPSAPMRALAAVGLRNMIWHLDFQRCSAYDR